jgi:hypothetical protein
LSDVSPDIKEAGYRFFQQVAQWINTLLTPPVWTEVTSFSNSWVNYDTAFNSAAYCKDVMGFVHLRGLVKDGTVDLAIFTLPVGYRPVKREIFTTQCDSTIARIDVFSTGVVAAIPSTNAGNAWISLDSITFYAG